jgi:alkylhydroperoxidase/carboxymuconolactone decarboxylase family protein YurZ
MDHYLGVAKEQGITEKEIGAVLAIVMAVSGGRVRAQFREVRARLKKNKTQKA